VPRPTQDRIIFIVSGLAKSPGELVEVDKSGVEEPT